MTPIVRFARSSTHSSCEDTMAGKAGRREVRFNSISEIVLRDAWLHVMTTSWRSKNNLRVFTIELDLQMNIRAQLKILMGKPIITQETSYKLKENIINVSLPACNIFRMRSNKVVKSIYIYIYISDWDTGYTYKKN